MDSKARERDIEQTEGVVFSVQHFSIHDGPGVRSTVFLSGCLLDCLWCHNPEGKASRPYVVFEAGKCRMCRACEGVCPNRCHEFADGKHSFHMQTCQQCGACMEACYYGALHWVGMKRTALDVIDEVKKDFRYFEESGGGITLSGGEPALQPKFAEALFLLAGKQGIHRCMETSGYASSRAYERLLPVTDLFLYDCKETDPERHKLFTGKEFQRIRNNLSFLDEHGANIILRCPIIPGCNDRAEHIEGIARLCLGLQNLKGVELLPYHSLGVSKAQRLGLKDQTKYEVPPAERIREWNDYLRKEHLPVL